MIGLFRKKDKPEEKFAEQLYSHVVKAARNPFFYDALEVPDTVDGRFEMISLHETLAIMRLELFAERAVDISQALFDAMFLDMDRSLREMGISDLRIPKHMKRMLNGFNGRALAYKAAIEANDEDLLGEAVRKNIYGTLETVDPSHIDQLCTYIDMQWKHLQTLNLEDFQNGKNIFIGREEQ